MGQVPLERALSKLGIASRRQTRQWIEEGLLAVNGRLVKDPSFLLVPETALITVNGKPVKRAALCTIVLYKPRGIVTTKSDEKGRATVYDILPAHLRHLHPVGRLDQASCGLLLMTTDTQFSHFLTNPQNQIPRVYAVSVKGKISQEQVKILSIGIWDEGECLKASKIILRKASFKESHLIITLTEGKNREIRRMFEALKSEVIVLKRIAFGKLTLDALMPGQWREITQKEMDACLPMSLS